jgi:hypothetical protein
VGLPCVKQRPLLTALSSITRGILIQAHGMERASQHETRLSESEHAICSKAGAKRGDKGLWLVWATRSLTRACLLTVNSCINVRLDLQADKSPVIVKGPFFPRVVNLRYRIRGTMCNTRIQSSKAR